MAGQTMTKPRGEKTQRYVFYLGLVLAAIAAIIVFVAVSSADSGGGTAQVPVLVANQDIPAQTRLSSDMVKVEYFDPEKANTEAFTSRSQVVDRVVTEDVKAGKPIVPATVSSTAGDGLTFKLEPGTRALSIGVQEVVTAGGNIRPGDHVDIVGLFQVDSAEAANHLLASFGTSYEVEAPPFTQQAAVDPEAQEPESFVLTATLLENVKVLALAQTLTPEASGNVADDAEEAETEPNASTATLQITPAQAQMLSTADEHGVFRLTGRPAGDEATPGVQPTLVVVE